MEMRLKQLGAWVCALCLCLSSAGAEVELLPQWSGWDLENVPVEVTLSAEVSARMPFDDARTEQLNRLLSHLSLRINHQVLKDETWSRVAVEVDGAQALSLKRRDTAEASMVQLSCLPDATCVSSRAATATDLAQTATATDLALTATVTDLAQTADPLALLLGDTASPEDAEQLLEAARLLSDGETLARGLKGALANFMEEKTVKTTIDKMGTARSKQVFTIPEESAESLSGILTGLCDAGLLRDLLSGTTFSGKQVVTLWRAENGDILKLSYEGRCGADAEHLRKATLSWSMRRDDEAVRDTLSFKSPAVKGSDRNTLSVSRVLSAKKDGSVALTASFKYEAVADKAKTTMTGEADLTRTDADGASHLSGSATLKRVAPDESSAQWTLTPALDFAAAQAVPGVSGTVGVDTKRNGKAQDSAVLHVGLSVGDYFEWELRDTSIQLNTLSAAGLEELTQKIRQQAATALVRALTTLSEEDAAFIAADLPEGAWNRIVEAAAGAAGE